MLLFGFKETPKYEKTREPASFIKIYANNYAGFDSTDILVSFQSVNNILSSHYLPGIAPQGCNA